MVLTAAGQGGGPASKRGPHWAPGLGRRERVGGFVSGTQDTSQAWRVCVCLCVSMYMHVCLCVSVCLCVCL